MPNEQPTDRVPEGEGDPRDVLLIKLISDGLIDKLQGYPAEVATNPVVLSAVAALVAAVSRATGTPAMAIQFITEAARAVITAGVKGGEP